DVPVTNRSSAVLAARAGFADSTKRANDHEANAASRRGGVFSVHFRSARGNKKNPRIAYCPEFYAVRRKTGKKQRGRQPQIPAAHGTSQPIPAPFGRWRVNLAFGRSPQSSRTVNS